MAAPKGNKFAEKPNSKYSTLPGVRVSKKEKEIVEYRLEVLGKSYADYIRELLFGDYGGRH